MFEMCFGKMVTKKPKIYTKKKKKTFDESKRYLIIQDSLTLSVTMKTCFCPPTNTTSILVKELQKDHSETGHFLFTN
jgi:hypothetical protein